jgi:hypothetical protein
MAAGDRSAEWQAWKEATFGSEYAIWHDGLSTEAVADLRGEARRRALEMLRLGLELGDSHAAEALAAMNEAGAAPAMRAQLHTAQGADRVRVALAVHAVTPDPELATRLVGVLRGHPSWSARVDAAIGLRQFAGAPDEAALIDAVAKDAEYLVRYHASESLLARWRVSPPEISKHPSVFSDICGPDEGKPSADDFVRYARARAELEKLKPG